jgi:alpha-L-rhamnosidase
MDQWSHCAVVPLYVLFEDLIGLRPTTPGYATYELRPQLAEAPAMDVIAQTPAGPIRIETQPTNDGCEVMVTGGANGVGRLLTPKESIDLNPGERSSIFLHRADRA